MVGRHLAPCYGYSILAGDSLSHLSASSCPRWLFETVLAADFWNEIVLSQIQLVSGHSYRDLQRDDQSVRWTSTASRVHIRVPAP